jgi:hypothetical protein
VRGGSGGCGFGYNIKAYTKVSLLRDWIMTIIRSKNIPVGKIEAVAMP